MRTMGPLTTCAVAAVATLFAGTVAAQTIVSCESINYRYQECRVPGGPVTLVRQLSRPPGDCIRGQSWGFNSRNSTLWVRDGCRAEFRVGSVGASPRPPASGTTVTCESINYRYQECRVRGGRVTLVRQLSRPPGDCIRGQSWGFNSRNSTLWVRDGCRAEFRVS